ncbi:hypothetical protein D1872_219720 [compost metagenome]
MHHIQHPGGCIYRFGVHRPPDIPHFAVHPQLHGLNRQIFRGWQSDGQLGVLLTDVQLVVKINVQLKHGILTENGGEPRRFGHKVLQALVVIVQPFVQFLLQRRR